MTKLQIKYPEDEVNTLKYNGNAKIVSAQPTVFDISEDREKFSF